MFAPAKRPHEKREAERAQDQAGRSPREAQGKVGHDADEDGSAR